jgi:beta-phosphoglucomutase
MADAGLRDLLVPTNVLGDHKLARLARLLERATVTVAVDDPGVLPGLDVTGGIEPDGVRPWLDAGALAVGLSSNLGTAGRGGSRGRAPLPCRPRCRVVSSRAVLFDFNGTLSHDEPIWFEVYRELYAARGRPITRAEYFEQLAGLSDEEGVERWLGASDPELIREGIARFLAAAGDGSTVPLDSREAVAAAAALVPVGIVTTARRHVLDGIVAAAGLTRHVTLTVTAEDVTRTKPDPEGYLVALARLDGVVAQEVLVFEDTPLGITAAKAAGMRCAAVLGSAPAERLGHADEIVERLDAATVLRLLA